MVLYHSWGKNVSSTVCLALTPGKPMGKTWSCTVILTPGWVQYIKKEYQQSVQVIFHRKWSMDPAKWTTFDRLALFLPFGSVLPLSNYCWPSQLYDYQCEILPSRWKNDFVSHLPWYGALTQSSFKSVWALMLVMYHLNTMFQCMTHKLANFIPELHTVSIEGLDGLTWSQCLCSCSIYPL